jgi:hypothetical protein
MRLNPQAIQVVSFETRQDQALAPIVTDTHCFVCE